MRSSKVASLCAVNFNVSTIGGRIRKKIASNCEIWRRNEEKALNASTKIVSLNPDQLWTGKGASMASFSLNQENCFFFIGCFKATPLQAHWIWIVMIDFVGLRFIWKTICFAPSVVNSSKEVRRVLTLVSLRKEGNPGMVYFSGRDCYCRVIFHIVSIHWRFFHAAYTAHLQVLLQTRPGQHPVDVNVMHARRERLIKGVGLILAPPQGSLLFKRHGDLFRFHLLPYVAPFRRPRTLNKWRRSIRAGAWTRPWLGDTPVRHFRPAFIVYFYHPVFSRYFFISFTWEHGWQLNVKNWSERCSVVGRIDPIPWHKEEIAKVF